MLNTTVNVTTSKSHVKFYQVSVFVITAVLYGILHASRTSWAYAKPTISQHTGYPDTVLALFDSSFLFAYGIGLFLSGWLGDRQKTKIMIAGGMILSALALANFAVVQGFMKEENIGVGMTAFILNGLGQSTGHPGCLSILTNWFPPQRRGLIFGLWATNTNLGNILGQQIGRVMIDTYSLPWPYVLLTSAILITGMAFVVLNYLYATPSEVTLTEQELQEVEFKKAFDEEAEAEASSPTVLAGSLSRSIGFLEAWREPGVFLYSLVYTCIKASMYGLLFWLPTYLKFELGFQEETAVILACLEVGQLLGAIILGYLSDKTKNRAVVILSSLTGAILTFFMVNFIESTKHKALLMALLFFGGFFLGGPSSLISGAVSSDLSATKEVAPGDKKVKSTSTIVGIVEGSGTLGAAIIQPIIPLFRGNSFILYTVLLLCAALLIPFAHRHMMKGKKEMKEVKEVKEEEPCKEIEMEKPPVELVV